MDFQLFIDNDKLYDFAAGTAKLLLPGADCSGKQCLAELKRDARLISRSCRAIERRFTDDSSMPAALRWLTDNNYMVEREYRAVSGDLARAKGLRLCGEGVMVYELCKALVRCSEGRVQAERCSSFMEGFQSVTTLRRSELIVLPALLRAAIIHSIAQICQELQYSPDMDKYSKPLGDLFTSLRLLSMQDSEKLLFSLDAINAILSDDPSGEYAGMDVETKKAYLDRVAELAKKRRCEERKLAEELIERAKGDKIHVGLLLFPPRHGHEGLYICANVVLSTFLTVLIALSCNSVPAIFLLLLPVSELVKNLIDFILLRTVRPRRLPGMDYTHGVSANSRTLCVFSTLLDDNSGERIYKRLETLYMACRREGRALSFGVLGDLKASDNEHSEGDEAIIRSCRTAVNRLNEKYGGGFYFFTRPRSFDGKRWCGSERKRGALEELAKLLCDRESALAVTGDKDALIGTPYILSLDSDTLVYPGSVGRLISAAAHPLNRPQLDESRGIVRSGHAIFHPRMATELKSAVATDFSIIFAGGGGSDPYSSLCSELYMDAFESGGFTGKGLIDAKSLLVCTEKHIPENAVLSHDAIEGAYLSGAFVGDAEFSDSFPSSLLSYFRRMERWTRGDWQNLPWLFGRGRDLRDIDRFKLFDSVRRSLIPAATLIAIVSGFFLRRGGAAIAAWAALLTLTDRILISLAEERASARTEGRLRRYSRILYGVGGAILQSFMRLWLLPFEAWVCFSAAARALWRMFVSRKNLLQWETAAESDRHGKGLGAHLKAMWFSLLCGALLLWLSPVIIARTAALMWLIAPIAASALSLPAVAERSLSDADRDYIRAAAGENWRYLARFTDPADGNLPPDNFQEQPPVGVAHRTSPTNIGLAMAAAVAAADMEIISQNEAVDYVDKVLSTLERLPKYRGQPYNWYDTRTLRPLKPTFISTVDNGNLYAALTSVSSAMAEFGNEALKGRIEALLSAMDFSPLYDKERELFYICLDTESGRGLGGWYDLMASEAMLTSFVAVSKGDTPIKHWPRLSRAQLQRDGYRGLASWSGTMFEYLMPLLFLPLSRGSLLYESSRFCLYVQRHSTQSGLPWGISESAYYSLDAALNYRYKAHGCEALSLRRERTESVISPYSSFLALSVDPIAAVKNLRRLESLGARGRFGFMEALDFDPMRCRSAVGEQVRCYMAHHISMSIIAAANALCEHSVRSRFMENSAMAAHALLLQERLAHDGIVLRSLEREKREKDSPLPEERWLIRGGEEDDERLCLLSNGAYDMSLGSDGKSEAKVRSFCVYRPDEGLQLRIKNDSGEIMSLPSPQENFELSEDYGRFYTENEALNCSVTAAVASGDRGEYRFIELNSSRDMSVEIELGFVPVLAEYKNYVNHPAYWQLGMNSKVKDNALYIRRIARPGCPEIYLALGAGMGAEYSSDELSGVGAISTPRVAMRLRLSLKRGEKRTVRLCLSLGDSESDAADALRRMLSARFGDFGNMLTAAGSMLKMKSADIGGAMELAKQLKDARLKEALPKRELWRHGISGENPIICCDSGAAEAKELLSRFILLKSCGMESDLVYLCDEQGEYRRPFQRELVSRLEKLGLEALYGAEGGVHCLPRKDSQAVLSRSALIVGEANRLPPEVPDIQLSLRRSVRTLPEYEQNSGGFVYYVNSNLPSRPWQNILSNGRFGYLASDCGSGAMWLENAREMPLTPWPELYSSVSGAEQLWAEENGRRISLFAANDGIACTVSYYPGLAVWEKEVFSNRVKMSIFIPQGTDARVIIIEGAAGLRLTWLMRLSMGGDAASVQIESDGRVFTARNADSYIPGVVLTGYAGEGASISSGFSTPAVLCTLTAGEVVTLVCGSAPAGEIVALGDAERAKTVLVRTKGHWEALCSSFTLKSGYEPMDDFMSSWAVYQAIACRISGRTSLYQSGGAYGFRDQLQDAVNMLLISPAYAAGQIKLCCRHQYVEGDVMHWWHPHPAGDKGVRTRCSDDLLWLVWALCEYVDATGDYSLCDSEVEFISSPPLRDDEHDRYEVPESSPNIASVLDHARSALDCCIARGVGEHGLPFIGSGDWNDGYDALGGESVWLGEFFAHCAERFSKLLYSLCKSDHGRYHAAAHAVGEASERCFDGEKYIRGYYADGTPLGGGERIDSLSQSWAVMNPFSDPGHCHAAVKTALRRLVDDKNHIVKLLDPPYSPDERSPGYISGYGEGFRENGGQYTHAAIWLAQACFKLGLSDDGYRIMRLILPEGRDMSRYGGEPFVLSADIYTAPGHVGEAGWTWYTGSAAWYFRVVSSELLGLRLRGGRLYIEPKLPRSLSGYQAEWTDYAAIRHRIVVGRDSIILDGKKCPPSTSI